MDDKWGKKANFRPWCPGVISLSINKGLPGVGKVFLVHKEDIWSYLSCLKGGLSAFPKVAKFSNSLL